MIEATSEEKEVTIALDSTKLLAADSAMFPTPGNRRDPFHKNAFKDVVTALCNPTILHYLSPPSIPERATPFLRIYSRLAEKAPLVKSSYRASGLKEALEEMANMFYELAKDDGKHIADWLHFQVDDDRLMHVFWSGGNKVDHLVEAKEAIEHLDWKGVSLYDFLVQDPLTPQNDQDTNNAVRKLGSLAWLGIAYAFHGFAKGRLYPTRIVDGPGYMSHWLRLKALPTSAEDGVDFLSAIPVECFPWGDLIWSLRTKATSIFASEHSLTESIEAIRSYSLVYQPKRLATIAPQVLEDYALSCLMQAGWLPEDHSSLSVDRLISEIRRVLRLPGLLAKTVETGGSFETKFLGLLVKTLDVGSWLEKRLVHFETRKPVLRIEGLSARRSDPDISLWTERYLRAQRPSDK